MKSRAGSGSFLREAAFGFVVSVVAAVAATTLTFVLPAGMVVRALVAGIGLALVLRALSRSNEKTGRIVTISLWLAAAAAAWLSGIGLPAYLAIHVLSVWLVRSLFGCARALEAGLELALALLAASFAIFAAVRTDSVFLASWSYLLVMALGVGIPALVAKWTESTPAEIAGDDPNRGFALASKAADEALQRIAARQRA
jgi:hypothetical protein